VLFMVGDQVPVIKLVEMVGKAAKAVPEQIATTGVNTGVTFGFTVIVNVAGEAH